jgi:hypothetical protein
VELDSLKVHSLDFFQRDHKWWLKAMTSFF